jgi:hypothetical protein
MGDACCVQAADPTYKGLINEAVKCIQDLLKWYGGHVGPCSLFQAFSEWNECLNATSRVGREGTGDLAKSSEPSYHLLWRAEWL